ncbi:hypothetical protein E2C01_095955 [Portunus trituberculatus]|uniref:Uncharacterized protein n=1 Tax=Portunus trituberculatus TaxID=210409 RepID=A0A5B7JRC7_PORTR|nr:hypothetical protein [Portunus trituberculatus]
MAECRLACQRPGDWRRGGRWQGAAGRSPDERSLARQVEGRDHLVAIGAVDDCHYGVEAQRVDAFSLTRCYLSHHC